MSHVDFAPGSLLVAYTDGLLEHDRGLDFDHTTQMLSEHILALQGTGAREISNAIASNIPIYAPDDIAYTVICRVESQDEPATLPL